jgi:serpin B
MHNGENMNKAIINLILILLFISVFCNPGCIETNENGDEEPDIPPTYDVIEKSMNQFVDSSNEFTFEMFKELIEKNENIFFSPYSISTALGMAYEGARGQTATEMANVLDFPDDQQTRWEMMKSVQSSLNKDDTSYELSTANAYWLTEDGKLKSEYKNAIEDYYLASGQQLDFAGDPKGAVDTINNWVEKETNEKIKDILSSDDIDALTYLILTNAIYFKSDWKYQFDTEATEPKDFTLANNDVIEVDTMNMCDESKKLNYAGNSVVQILQLPYKDEELSMFILLPKENDISTLEAKLDANYFSNLKDKMSSEWIDLYLPKFKMELKFKLKEKLYKMGMPTAFSTGADFSGITSDADLYIDQVIHQSFVEVDEEGTEAAAATAVVVQTTSIGSPTPKPITFRADHPFIFLIQHKDSGQILFMGKVENPNG